MTTIWKLFPSLLIFYSLCLLAACSPSATPAPTPTLDPVITKGKSVFSQHCASCHSTAADTIIVGPSLTGIATRGASRLDGIDARQYIELSILNPSAYVVDGFEDAMPTLAKKITSEELDALVTYLMTLE